MLDEERVSISEYAVDGTFSAAVDARMLGCRAATKKITGRIVRAVVVHGIS
jgi:hypothetical protein